jgi:hypothetical protein
VAKLAITDKTIDALTAMPGDMRDAAVLMLVGRFSASESAEILDAAKETVVKNLRSAKTYLRRHLRPQPISRPRVAVRGRTRRATRRRATRTSRGDPSSSKPRPRPSDLEAPSGASSSRVPADFGAVALDVGPRFSGSSTGRDQQLSPTETTHHKETDMVINDPDDLRWHKP